jgi:hypothetical protein
MPVTKAQVYARSILSFRTVNHAGRLIDGEDFYMYGRKHGYTPRIA